MQRESYEWPSLLENIHSVHLAERSNPNKPNQFERKQGEGGGIKRA